MIERDYNLKPTKPCMDGEPRYEDHAYQVGTRKTVGLTITMFVRLLIGLCLLALMGTLMVATMFGSFTCPEKRQPDVHTLRTPWQRSA
jgi:hypothetical protein